MTKKEIRAEVFRRRKETKEYYIRAASEKITEILTRLQVYQEASHLYAYMDFNREVMTKGLIERAWADGKKVAVPKVHGQDMTYYVLESFDQLESGYFGIPEPAYGETAHFEDALMIVPGVAFDREGHRCGYGQGFYDRYLAAHPLHKTVAVAFNFQIFPEVPAETFDRSMDLVITETRCYR